MKPFIPAVLLLLVFTGCRKVYTDQAAIAASGNDDGLIETIDEDAFFCIFPTEAAFPGGMNAWQQFLQTGLAEQMNAQQDCVQGTAIVQFMVDTAGRVSNVEAVSGPHPLQEMAIEVVQQSPAWTPARIHGNPVNSYKRQPIVFRLE